MSLRKEEAEMATYDLEKVDEIRRRLNASYQEALAGLEEAQGDLVKALVAVEKRRKESPEVACDTLLERVFSLSQERSLTGLRVRFGPRVVKEIPIGRGALSALAASLLAVVADQFRIELIREETSKAEPEKAPAQEEAPKE